MKKSTILVLLAVVSVSGLLFARSKASSPVFTPTRKPTAETLNYIFPGDSKLVFEQSDQLFVYSIKSMMASEQKNTFQGYPIVGRSEVKDKQSKAAVVAHFYDGVVDEGLPSGCFNPHHGLRAVKGNQVVDLVICFECSNVKIEYRGQSRVTSTGPKPEIFFNQILTDAGIRTNVSNN